MAKAKAKTRRNPGTKLNADDHIPRPPNSFILYRIDIAAKCGKHMARLLSKVIGHRWRNETPECKAYYTEKARQAAELHKHENPDYKFRPAQRGYGKRAKQLKAIAPIAAKAGISPAEALKRAKRRANSKFQPSEEVDVAVANARQCLQDHIEAAVTYSGDPSAGSQDDAKISPKRLRRMKNPKTTAASGHSSSVHFQVEKEKRERLVVTKDSRKRRCTATATLARSSRVAIDIKKEEPEASSIKKEESEDKVIDYACRRRRPRCHGKEKTISPQAMSTPSPSPSPDPVTAVAAHEGEWRCVLSQGSILASPAWSTTSTLSSCDDVCITTDEEEEEDEDDDDDDDDQATVVDDDIKDKDYVPRSRMGKRRRQHSRGNASNNNHCIQPVRRVRLKLTPPALPDYPVVIPSPSTTATASKLEQAMVPYGVSELMHRDLKADPSPLPIKIVSTKASVHHFTKSTSPQVDSPCTPAMRMVTYSYPSPDMTLSEIASPPALLDDMDGSESTLSVVDSQDPVSWEHDILYKDSHHTPSTALELFDPRRLASQTETHWDSTYYTEQSITAPLCPSMSVVPSTPTALSFVPSMGPLLPSIVPGHLSLSQSQPALSFMVSSAVRQSITITSSWPMSNSPVPKLPIMPGSSMVGLPLMSFQSTMTSGGVRSTATPWEDMPLTALTADRELTMGMSIEDEDVDHLGEYVNSDMATKQNDSDVLDTCISSSQHQAHAICAP
ncbi:hypothetical protein BGZ73_004484 [Actinomortierella ambigua]|nr:hypothetical protein BGZ73_004484 [Actinomortierella ambigua]